jgi:hypothetical protein
LFFAVIDAELNINMLDNFAKAIPELHPKPEGSYPTCFCGDTCKIEVSGDYKTLIEILDMLVLMILNRVT